MGTTAAPLNIGAALSGGGAAALAHVGVFDALTAAGITVDCVAANSAGAMVGAAYVAGYLDDFREAMCALTRRRVLWLFDPKWPHSGLLQGRRSLELVRPYVGERIETLPRPFATVATDLQSGAEVILRHGDVIDAIRASIAIPGLFTPQEWEGRLLVDGGLVNPLPVDVARQLGGEFVIAVSVLNIPDDSLLRPPERHGLSAQLLKRFLSRLNGHAAAPAVTRAAKSATARAPDLGLIDILSKATGVVQAHIAANRLREQPADFLLSVSLPDVGLFDFHRAAEIIEAGRAATQHALPEIRAALADALSLRHRVTRWIGGGSF